MINAGPHRHGWFSPCANCGHTKLNHWEFGRIDRVGHCKADGWMTCTCAMYEYLASPVRLSRRVKT